MALSPELEAFAAQVAGGPSLPTGWGMSADFIVDKWQVVFENSEGFSIAFEMSGDLSSDDIEKVLCDVIEEVKARR